MSNYYAVLGVTPDSDEEVIDAAYRALIKKYHPDVGAAGVSDRSAEINEAYAVLRDPRKRAEYDSKLGSKRLSNAAPQSSRTNGSERGSADPSSTKECPDCAERVQRGARVCRYCGYAFHGHVDPQPKQVEARPSPRSTIARPLLAVSGILFLLWLLGLCSVTLPPDSDGNADIVPAMNTREGEGEATDVVEQAAATPAAPPPITEMLRNGDAQACADSQVIDNVQNSILEPLDTIYGSERAPKIKAQVEVSLSEIGQLTFDNETSLMGCTANAHITTAAGTRAVPVEYVLRPSLEPKYDYLISGNWKAAQNVVANTVALHQFFGAENAPTPEIVSDRGP